MTDIIGGLLGEAGIDKWGVLSAEDAVFLGKPRGELPESYIFMLLPYPVCEPSCANVAAFAAFPDYHASIGSLLNKLCGELKEHFPGESFAGSADASMLNEIACAAKCGLGVVGMNNLLINANFGSYCFIAEIGTSLALPSEPKTPETCAGCGCCVSACPTGALSEGGYDHSVCLSQITQKKGELSSREAAAVASAPSVWGCDICQQVCPMNAGRSCGDPHFGELTPSVTEELVGDEGFFSASAFAWRGKEPILRNLRLKK